MSVHGPTDWTVVSTPAVSTQATATKAAQAGMAHVCTGIFASLMAVAAQTIILLNLRDGATGAGTILWSKQYVVPINGVLDINVPDLSIKGTIGNAMTLEWSAAPVATNYEAVTMTGYDSA
jgi:hypothetical protein